MSLTPGLSSRLDKLVAHHVELSRQLGDPGLSGSDIAKLSKEYSDLTPVVESIAALRNAEAERADLQGMIGGDDAEMRDLAQGELAALDKKIPELEAASR